ncbi:hypothetical protein TRAPUB_4695 [Trametes pubescens]|uniref:Uncharacterized protein n=1 Tax=Trametes pubescens TaxID=154538 RepID=A0A1M2VAK8_TRAPU|nr:hypothetical protein TRAPUB_4695 [Trametes pubescens]
MPRLQTLTTRLSGSGNGIDTSAAPPPASFVGNATNSAATPGRRSVGPPTLPLCWRTAGLFHAACIVGTSYRVRSQPVSTRTALTASAF